MDHKWDPLDNGGLPISALFFNSKRTTAIVFLGTLAGYCSALYFQNTHPYHNYSAYPEALSILLALSFLIAAGFHTYIFMRFATQIRHRYDKRRVIAHHFSKMAEIGRLAGNVAHEINTPLTTLLFMADNIRDHLERGDVRSALSSLDRQDIIIKRIADSMKILLRASRSSLSNKQAFIEPHLIFKDLETLLTYRLGAKPP